MRPIDRLRRHRPSRLPSIGSWLTDPEADAIADVLASDDEDQAAEAREWCERRLRAWSRREVRP